MAFWDNRCTMHAAVDDYGKARASPSGFASRETSPTAFINQSGGPADHLERSEYRLRWSASVNPFLRHCRNQLQGIMRR